MLKSITGTINTDKALWGKVLIRTGGFGLSKHTVAVNKTLIYRFIYGSNSGFRQDNQQPRLWVMN